MTSTRTSQPLAPSRRYGVMPFLIIITTAIVLVASTLLLDDVPRGLVAALWLPLGGLLVWASVRLCKEYRRVQEESVRAMTEGRALRQSQERNAAIIENALDAVITINDAGVVTDWNSRAAIMFGWTRDEAVGRLLSETAIPFREGEPFLQGFLNDLKTGSGLFLNRRIETMGRGKGGCDFPVELTVLPMRGGETDLFCAFIRDITVRRRAERRLAAQYAVTRVLSDAAMLEEAVPKIMEAVGSSLEWDLATYWKVDKRAGLLRCLAQWKVADFDAGEFVKESQERVFKKGEGFPGRIWESGRPIWVTDIMTDPNFLRSAAAQEKLHGAFGFPIRVGDEIEGVIEFLSRFVQEVDGELLEMMADVGLKIGQFVERTRAEEALRQTESQLRQSQKMEAIGRLAGGIAHDFNNLLTVIRGYSDLVLARIAPDDPSRREMEEVRKAADRAAGLTRQLLAFSRRQIVSPKVLDLNAVITNMDGMLRRLVGEDLIELWTDLDPDVWPIKADPGQIEQVIMNLAVNARDAMPAGGRLTIETRNVTIKAGSLEERVSVEEGSYVMLVVRDTGHGMTEDVQSHLFEPFFTTKESGKGTGLGLSTVYGIVKQSGGTIGIESKPGQGTTCKIFFPRVIAPGQEDDAGQKGTSVTKGQETVLLVEDDPSVRGFVQETLRMNGYQVLVARHGIDALLVGAGHMGPIHLLLTDVVMPQMSGPEIAQKLAVLRPETKVLYMSGYPDHPFFKNDQVEPEINFLQKPFTPTVLAKKVREVLDRSNVA